MTSLPRLSVENPVLANMLTLAILAGGVLAGLTLVRDMFPESRRNQVLISALYPGATPQEVEKGLALRIEEAIKDIEHIEKIEARISEGVCNLIVSLTSEARDLDQKVNEFKAAIDAIPRDELPEEAEETRVLKFEPRLPVISVAVYGDVDEAALKAAGQRLRDDLLLLPGISDVELAGTRKGELTVEVRPEKLIEYRVSLGQVAAAIRASNLDLPAGQIKLADQNVAVRTLGESDQSQIIAQTIVRSDPAGRVLRVADLGRVIDGFEDTEVRGRFNGKPAVDITVYKTPAQDAIDISRKVRAFVRAKRNEPPEAGLLTPLKSALGMRSAEQEVYVRALSAPYPRGLELQTHSNLARYIEGRLELLSRNALWGTLLVFLSLLAFLNWRVAFWVMLGLLVAVCGALMLMQWLGQTLNLISMFGLIVVLGLLVDDAIVVGENIYARAEQGEEPRLAAVRGAEEITGPVIVAVLTTIGAFLPLLFIEGRIGDFMGVLPIVVTCALSVSLVEALAILPAHLAGSLKHVRAAQRGPAPPVHPTSWLRRLRQRQQRWFGLHLAALYDRLLRLAIQYRYVTVAAVVTMLILAIGMVAGGRVPFVFVQKMDSETILVNLEMPVGTPTDRTEQALRVVEEAALRLRDSGELRSVYALVGAQITADEGGAIIAFRSHLGQAIIELATVDQRTRSSEQIIGELRKQTANLPGVNALRYRSMQGGPAGAEIEIEITGKDFDQIVRVAGVLKDKLAEFHGVFDLADDFEEGRREVQLELLESARPLELTTRALASEVRGAFYGLEARTLQREREDVDIRVRYPESRRKQLYDLESMRIATPAGNLVPLCEVARLNEARGFSSIRRIDQRRAVVVSADVDQAQANAEQISEVLAGTFAELERDQAGVRLALAGNKRELTKSMGSLRRDFVIALMLIYVMLAGLFKSYVQPLIVMTAVPFGLNGAVVGHYLMGYPLTILSMIGLVALTGIVVNDALILVDFVNRERAAGRSLRDALINAARRRLRPILLTSITTILGLAPLMAEQSFQARFLIPMAISLTFGLAFATVLTLLVVPAIYLILEDLNSVARAVWYGAAGSLSERTPNPSPEA